MSAACLTARIPMETSSPRASSRRDSFPARSKFSPGGCDTGRNGQNTPPAGRLDDRRGPRLDFWPRAPLLDFVGVHRQGRFGPAPTLVMRSIRPAFLSRPGDRGDAAIGRASIWWMVRWLLSGVVLAIGL